MNRIRGFAGRECVLMLFYLLCLSMAWEPSLYRGIASWREEGKEQRITEDVSETAVSAEPSSAESSPRIALTFDDGPSGECTLDLLDGLKERGVKASFFLIGQNVDRYPEVVKRMEEDGHLLGNHTYHHVELTALSDEEACREIMDTREAIRRATGKDTEYMRPPFGSWKDSMEEELAVLPVMWTVDPLDWTTENTDEIVDRVVTETEENDIILLHDCYQSSVEAALRIVDLLQKAGFEFVTVDELLMD